MHVLFTARSCVGHNLCAAVIEWSLSLVTTLRCVGPKSVRECYNLTVIC
jgi:hypothetical protein